MRVWSSFIHALRHDQRIQTLWVAPTFLVFLCSVSLNEPHVLQIIDGALCMYAVSLLWKLQTVTLYVGVTMTAAATLHGLLYGLPHPGLAWPTVALQVAAWPLCFWLKRRWRLEAAARALLAELVDLTPFERARRWSIGRPSLREAWLDSGAEPEVVRHAGVILIGALNDDEFRELTALVEANCRTRPDE